MKATQSFAIAAAALLLSSRLTAHHSPAQFDQERHLTLEVVVMQVEWTNPHVHVSVEESRVPGRRVIWRIAAQSPRVMSLFGWSPTSLTRGDRVTIVAHPARNAETGTALGRSVRKLDGTVLRIPWSPQEIRDALQAESRKPG